MSSLAVKANRAIDLGTDTGTNEVFVRKCISVLLQGTWALGDNCWLEQQAKTPWKRRPEVGLEQWTRMENKERHKQGRKEKSCWGPGRGDSTPSSRVWSSLLPFSREIPFKRAPLA